MGTLVGRDAEVNRGRAVFDSALRGRQVRAVRIVGRSGVGKTALADALLEVARNNGWLVLEAPSFRIHASLTLFAARRVLQLLLETLGEEAAHYQSGLAIDRERPEDFEETFLRLLEGVTLDHRLLLFMDDAQWVDARSRALIAHTLTALSNRSIVLLSTERSDEISGPAFTLVDEVIALSDLSPQASMTIVRSIYPGVTTEVASTIAAATRGHALDIVAVATAARENGATTVREVGESARRVVARDLALLDPQVRTFLQTCALIEEPIAFDLLQQIYPPEQLLSMISLVSGRYLAGQSEGMQFVHATIMESVRETIPIEIPLRYRIIEAIQKLVSPQLEDYERLAAQSRAVGDRVLEREALLTVAEVAATRGMASLAADAIERAHAIARPEPKSIVPMYARLSQLYNVLGRELDCIRACQTGLAEAESAGITQGLGAIIASMIFAKWNAGRDEEALADFRRYEAIFTEPADRAQILSAGGYMAMHRADEPELIRLQNGLRELTAASPLATTRYHVLTAFFELRRGNEQTALKAMGEADRAAEAVPHMTGMTRNMHAMHAFFGSGVREAERELDRLGIGPREPTFVWAKPQLLIARGALHDAEEFIVEHLESVRDPFSRRFLVGALGTAAVLRDAALSDAAWTIVAEEGSFFESGTHASILRPIAAAWTVALSATAPKRAKFLVDQLVAQMRHAPDYGVTFYPFVLVVTARKLDDRSTLALLAEGRDIWVDRQPWMQAHFTLARGMAAAALGKAQRAALLDKAIEQFETLGAPAFAQIARDARPGQTNAVAPKAQISNTTRREREIAALVAEGLTNRQIAEKLVLSERTVEGHIANLFAKVNVNSRTQLAAWYLRSVAPVA